MTHPETPVLTEGDMQCAVYNYRLMVQPFPLVLTNIYLFDWESDAVFITRDGFVYEYEIKRTRADFKADFVKTGKHAALHNGDGPAMFYYVCPPDLIAVDDLPKYAGLCYVVPSLKYRSLATVGGHSAMSLRIVKQAKRREASKPITERQWRSVAHKACGRYWSLKRHWA